MNEFTELVLKLEANPSTKLALIVLLENGDPMTTKDLNNALNQNKTLENYKILFKNELASGLVEMFPQRTKSGITRIHFSVNTSKLTEE